jgi:hypothetical protein
MVCRRPKNACTCKSEQLLNKAVHVSAEILDFGYPQNSETDTLKMYITTEGVKSEQAVVSARLRRNAFLCFILMRYVLSIMFSEKTLPKLRYRQQVRLHGVGPMLNIGRTRRS